jgi:hypothetical protein
MHFAQTADHLLVLPTVAGRHRSLSEFLSSRPQDVGMLDNERLQIAGPISIICAISCAEIGALALASWPTSPFLWYVNLELFRPIQYSGIGMTPWLGDFEFAVCIAISLLGLVSAGLFLRSRMPLAIASNFGLIYSFCLLYGSYAASEAAISPGLKLSALWSPSAFLAIVVLLISFLSSAVSHRSYLREIFT